MKNDLNKALEIAKDVHRYQKDKAGVDYINHPLTVSRTVKGKKAKIVALLHDTIQVGDPVIYREDSSFSEPFNFDIEPLYIVIRFIKDSPYPKERLLLKKGFIYVISNIKEDCGSGHLGGITYVKESQLKLYTENNPDVLSFYCDAKEELKKLI